MLFKRVIFTDYQLAMNLQGDSVIEQLSILTQKCMSSNPTSENVLNQYKERMKINSFQFEWTLLNVLAALQLWDKLSQFFIKMVNIYSNSKLTSNTNLHFILLELVKKKEGYRVRN